MTSFLKDNNSSQDAREDFLFNQDLKTVNNAELSRLGTINIKKLKEVESFEPSGVNTL